MQLAATARSLSRRLGARRLGIPILYYHEVGVERARHVVHAEDFAAQVAWLVDSGFQMLSLDDVVGIYAGTRAIPSRPVAITFDDGRAGVLRHAMPVLRRHGIPAMAYVVTGWADGREIPAYERYSDFLDWKQIEELRGAGFHIGSHTVTHRNLKKIAPEEIVEEVSASRRRLEDRLAEPVVHFSFPRGRSPRHAVSAVRRAGYRTAVATGQRWNGRFARLHRLGRLRVDGLAGPGALEGLLAAPRGEGTAQRASRGRSGGGG